VRELPRDIHRHLERCFTSEDQDLALLLIREAKLHDGTVPEDRLVRCALVAANGSLVHLRSLIELLTIDYRDVIVAGEYAMKDGDLVQVRDLQKPIRSNN
jgi:hypothetical protein